MENTTATAPVIDHAKQNAQGRYESIIDLVARRDHANDCKCSYDDDLTDELCDGLSSESAFDEFHDVDAIEQEIQNGPLSVQVRSGWAAPGETMQAEQFEILLTTGGPALRIMGELDEYKQPDRAWLEYQDWGTPWTRYFGADQDTLLSYCQQFYFGE